MKWFKHHTNLKRQQDVAAFTGACEKCDRLAGYGFMTLLFEVVAEQMSPDRPQPSATFSHSQWAHLLDCHHHTVEKFLRKLELSGLVVLKTHDSGIEVVVPEMSKWADEYMRKSGHTPDKVAQRREDKKKPYREETKEDARERTSTPGVKDSDFLAPRVPNGIPLSGLGLGQLSNQARGNDPRPFDELKLLVKPHIERFGADPDLIYRFAGASLRMTKKQIAECVRQLVADCEVTLPVEPLAP